MAAVEAAATIGRAWAGPGAPPPGRRARAGGSVATTVLNEATGKRLLRVHGVPVPAGAVCASAGPRWSPPRTCGPGRGEGRWASPTRPSTRPCGSAWSSPPTSARPPPCCWPGTRPCWSSGSCRAGSSSCWSGVRERPGVRAGAQPRRRRRADRAGARRRPPAAARPTRAEIRRALLGLRCAPLLTGYRGAPPADLDRVVDVVGQVAELVLSRPEVVVAGDQPVDRHGGRGVGVRRAGDHVSESGGRQLAELAEPAGWVDAASSPLSTAASRMRLTSVSEEGA